MGLSFDGNGRYVSWSNLFKYSSIEALRASEYLPMPKKKIYTKTDSGVNIDSFINEIVSTNTDADEIWGYVKLLNYLNLNNITEITYTNPEGDTILNKIMSHEFTKIPYSLQEDANKNFISSHILNTVLNLRNMIGAYSPIEMEDFRAASESSPKGELSSRMTLLNPATKLLMQYLNITGKNVIGIAANGEKASFMWHYYINDVVLKLNVDIKTLLPMFNRLIYTFNLTSSIEYEYIDVVKYIMDSVYREKVLEAYAAITSLKEPLEKLTPYIKLVERALFSFNTSRIKDRFKGTPVNLEINTLPDVNFEGVDPEIVKYFGNRLTGDITVDLMISLVLSAATDSRF